MKKLIILSIIAIFSSISLQTAQAQSPVKFGIKAGVNFANYNDLDGNIDGRSGLLIGGVLNISLPAVPLSIQPEVLYSQKGAEEDGTEINVDYLDIPVVAKLNLVPSGPVHLNLQAGPYISFPLNSEISDSGLSIDIDNTQTDFGGVVGVGVDVGLGVSSLILDARYGFAFNDAFEDGQGKNAVFSVAVGLLF